MSTDNDASPSGVPAHIENPADVIVGSPIPRDVIRSVETAFLANCRGDPCQWQGLFPTAEMAAEAVQNHQENWDLDDGPHFYTPGNRIEVIELADLQTAYTLHESEIGTENELREWYFPRTTQAVSDLVERGDRIELPADREQKVSRVNKTRSCGLPTWSVGFCDMDADLIQDDLPARGKNELIAQSGEIYHSFGECPLASPAFEIIGRTDHQASINAFDNRGEAHAE